MESDKICSQCGGNLKGSAKVRMHSYWKVSCLDQQWQLYVCNLCRDKHIQAPCDETQLKWQKIKNPFAIKHNR